MHFVNVFDIDPAHDFFHRHATEFDTAKQVGSESPEMLPHQATHLARALLVSKSNLQIVECEAPIFRKNHAGGRAG